MYCSKCGAVLAEGAAYCATCGQAVPAGPRMAPPVSAALPAAGTVAVPAPSSAYAGFWLRFVAFIIDAIILGMPVAFIFGIVAAGFGLGTGMTGEINEPPRAIFAVLIPFIVLASLAALAGGWLYYALMESSAWQATLGKKALGLFVTDLAGRQVSFARATGRYFGKIISGHFTIYIGYIMAGFTAKKQALHDMMAGCLVLRRI